MHHFFRYVTQWDVSKRVVILLFSSFESMSIGTSFLMYSVLSDDLLCSTEGRLELSSTEGHFNVAP
jgi:hypothetical protein